MIVYFVLIAVPFLLQFVARKKEQRRWAIGRSRYIQEHNVAFVSFFYLLFFVLVFRHPFVGSDTDNYKRIFLLYRDYSFKEALISFDFSTEYLFKILYWVISRITDNFTLCLFILTIFTLVPIAKVYCEDNVNCFLEISIFVNMSTFIMLFSGVRQSLAIGIAFLAYGYVRKKKLLPFVIACVVAYFVHHSAIVMILMYPAYYIKIRRKHLIVIFPLLLAVFALRQKIFMFLGRFVNDYSVEVLETNAFGSLILFFILSVVTFFVVSDDNIDEETNGLRNFLLISVALQCFASLHPLAMRLNYYYIFFIPRAIGHTYEHCVPVSKDMGAIFQVMKYGIMAIFVSLYVREIYVSFVTGESILHTVPYHFVWENF